MIQFRELLDRLVKRGVEVRPRPLSFYGIPGIVDDSDSFEVTDDLGQVPVWVFCTRVLVPFSPLTYTFPLLKLDDTIPFPVVEAACAALKVDLDVVMGWATDPDEEPEPPA